MRAAKAVLTHVLLLTVSISYLSDNVHAASGQEAALGSNTPMKNDDAAIVIDKDVNYDQYINFFEEVFTAMQENYYMDVQRADFDRFIAHFNENIYPQLKEEHKSNDYVRWRAAAYMIDFLKSKEDIFSAFYPPKPAKEYEETALGVKIDLGITGNLTPDGYRVTAIEPRSDAYEKGLRESDIIRRIDEQEVAGLSQERVTELLTPLVDAKVTIVYLKHPDVAEHVIEVTSKEYFKQTVFLKPINFPHVYCLEIRKFNRKTAEDLFRFLDYIKMQGPINGLVLDLRDNPGGPPLAAREISSFFLPAGEEFAYFQKKNQPKASLDVPAIPIEYHYDGPLVILINEKSGSASELFAGVLQRRGRAVLMGVNSAGQVMLKSMFPFADESMLLLVTARGHHPDGMVFSFGGLVPDRYVNKDDGMDLVNYAATYLMYIKFKDQL